MSCEVVSYRNLPGVREPAFLRGRKALQPSRAAPILELTCEKNPFLHTQNNLILSVHVSVRGAKRLEAKCDSRLSSSEPSETAAAVDFSLSPGGQSVAYRPAYGL